MLVLLSMSIHFLVYFYRIKISSVVVVREVKLKYFIPKIEHKDGMHHSMVVQLLASQNNQLYFY